METIGAIIIAYLIAAGLLVRFMHFVHKRDEEMHKITAEWVNTKGRSPILSNSQV